MSTINLEPIRHLILQPQLIALVAAILLNTALAIAASIKHKSFYLPELATFLYHDILPLSITYIAFAVAGDAVDIPAVKHIVWSTLMTSLIARIKRKLDAILNHDQR